jgi:hypothetical protein
MAEEENTDLEFDLDWIYIGATITIRRRQSCTKITINETNKMKSSKVDVIS